MYFSKLIATGSCVPAQVITNDRLSEMVDTSDEWIQSRSGIGKRHFSTGENASDLAIGTAKDVLRKCDIRPEDIELIIVATVSGDYTTPSVACLVQAAIGATNALAFDISAACSGFVFGLSVADKFIKTGVYRNALVIGTEVLSKYINFEDRSTCVLFGDGSGGAMVVRSDEPGILCEEVGSDGAKGLSLTCGHVPAASPYNQVERGTDPYIHMDGRAIFDFATRAVPKSVQKLLEKAGVSTEEIDLVVPHQANSRIVEIISRKLHIPMEKFYLNMFEYANTSSATIPSALNELAEKGQLTEGKLILLCGFGAGLTWGSMLIRL